MSEPSRPAVATRGGFLLLHQRIPRWAEVATENADGPITGLDEIVIVDRWTHYAAIYAVHQHEGGGGCSVSVNGPAGGAEVNVTESADDVLRAIDSCEWAALRSKGKAIMWARERPH